MAKKKWAIELKPEPHQYPSVWCLRTDAKKGKELDDFHAFYFGTFRKPVDYSGSNGNGTGFIRPCSVAEMWTVLSRVWAEGATFTIEKPADTKVVLAPVGVPKEFRRAVERLYKQGARSSYGR